MNNTKHKTKLNWLPLIFLLFANNSIADTKQSIESIQAAVSEYVTANIDASGDYRITIDRLDSRLTLTQCKTPLSAFTPGGIVTTGRISVGIRCNDARTWTIFTTAHIDAFQEIVVLARPAARGEILTKSHLRLQRKNLAKFRQGFFTDYQQVLNKQATRHLAEGTVLSQRLVAEPKIIRRGEKVTILAASAALQIRMTGIAMMDGLKGQRIRIKNQQSKRIIEATVLQPGLVSVSF